MPRAALTAMPGGVRISIRAQPRARRDAIGGIVDDGHGGSVLKVYVTAPPVEGAANEAIARLIAATLGVAKSAVVVARGASGRIKAVEARGVAFEEARQRLGLQKH